MLWINLKNRGKLRVLFCDVPRWSLNQQLSSDLNPSIVFTWTSLKPSLSPSLVGSLRLLVDSLLFVPHFASDVHRCCIAEMRTWLADRWTNMNVNMISIYGLMHILSLLKKNIWEFVKKTGFKWLGVGVESGNRKSSKSGLAQFPEIVSYSALKYPHWHDYLRFRDDAFIVYYSLSQYQHM